MRDEDWKPKATKRRTEMKVTKMLNEYRRYLRKEHPDTTAKVTVAKKRGWVRCPTGLQVYLVYLEVVGEGYHTIHPVLNIERNGCWYVIGAWK